MDWLLAVSPSFQIPQNDNTDLALTWDEALVQKVLQIFLDKVELVLPNIAENLDYTCSVPTDLFIQLKPLFHILRRRALKHNS